MSVWSSVLRREYADTECGQVHFGRGGGGPPVLMLHSTPRSHHQFQLLYPDLVERFDVIAPDTLGFGGSAPLPADASFERIADNLATLLDRLGVARAHVYGFHTGNKIGASFAARHPERTDRLVLSGQTHSLIADKTKRDGAIANIVAKYFTGKNDPKSGYLRKWTSDFGIMSGIWLDPTVMGEDHLDEDRLSALERYVADYILARHTIVPIYEANFAFDFEQAVLAIRAPTLIMEFATPQEEVLERQGEALAALIGDAKAIVYENTGAHAHDTRAAEIAHAITDFLLEPL